jgi:hypothetical protein
LSYGTYGFLATSLTSYFLEEIVWVFARLLFFSGIYLAEELVLFILTIDFEGSGYDAFYFALLPFPVLCYVNLLARFLFILDSIAEKN